MVINGKSAAAALVKARAAMKATVSKDSRGNFGKYADLANVVAAITPALADAGLALVQEIETDADNVTASAMLVHETGETIEFCPLSLPIGDKRGAQAIGAVITYARRYQLMALFGLAPDDDLANASQTRTDAPGRATPNHAATAPKAPQRPAAPATAHIDDAPPVDENGPENLFETAVPTEREAAILNKWQSPEDAIAWATRIGGSKNEYEARNAYKKVLRDQFGNVETDANRSAVWLAYMRHEGQKWQAKQQAQQPQPEAA